MGVKKNSRNTDVCRAGKQNKCLKGKDRVYLFFLTSSEFSLHYKPATSSLKGHQSRRDEMTDPNGRYESRKKAAIFSPGQSAHQCRNEICWEKRVIFEDATERYTLKMPILFLHVLCGNTTI
ncbi:hypothetical protein CEXT_653121 [Caerostris extrusa]|uniref:Uncharacterized protein n=1 Tax=Caerostris extrusa TaxID=172846 RepID=A0AAV4VE23_CAEEX|nr:hypothetical protein CEXT_653121 [Caerostris extrusa]